MPERTLSTKDERMSKPKRLGPNKLVRNGSFFSLFVGLDFVARGPIRVRFGSRSSAVGGELFEDYSRTIPFMLTCKVSTRRHCYTRLDHVGPRTFPFTSLVLRLSLERVGLRAQVVDLQLILLECKSYISSRHFFFLFA